MFVLKAVFYSNPTTHFKHLQQRNSWGNLQIFIRALLLSRYLKNVYVLNQGCYIRRTTIFIFSLCTGLVTKLNGSALGVLKHHYITKRIREFLIGNSRFLIYNSLNQLLYTQHKRKLPYRD